MLPLLVAIRTPLLIVVLVRLFWFVSVAMPVNGVRVVPTVNVPEPVNPVAVLLPIEPPKVMLPAPLVLPEPTTFKANVELVGARRLTAKLVRPALLSVITVGFELLLLLLERTSGLVPPTLVSTML